ncbi:hypothetical protein TNCV_1442701 [Trichonephila clavipes]|nr:hypothetical protein TNCV_1442701 [Trichonephila clavipes]
MLRITIGLVNESHSCGQEHVYELNNSIQFNIQSEAVTCKSIDIVVKADEEVNYPTELFNPRSLAWGVLYTPATRKSSQDSKNNA